MDLWDLDEVAAEGVPAVPLKKRVAEEAPESGEGGSAGEAGSGAGEAARLAKPKPIKRNLPNRSSFRVHSGSTVSPGSAMESDFADLEEWVDVVEKRAGEVEELEVEDEGDGEVVVDLVDGGGEGDAGVRDESGDVVVEAREEEDEFSVVKRVDPSSVVRGPRVALSGLERAGLVGFVLLMVGGGVFFLTQSINRLPQVEPRLRAQDFPVQGKVVRVDGVTSYWREPETDEVVRRGTVLIPAVEVKLGGGTGAIRVFFNDEEGQRVGDPINLAVGGGGVQKLAATAGFEELSMHAAYRTGGTEPWTIEIFEGPSVNAPGADFKKLLEVPVSSERR